MDAVLYVKAVVGDVAPPIRIRLVRLQHRSDQRLLVTHQNLESLEGKEEMEEEMEEEEEEKEDMKTNDGRL